MGVAQQVARAAPPLDVVGGIRPGGAGQLPLAAEELHVDRRGGELEPAQNVTSRAELLVDGAEDAVRQQARVQLISQTRNLTYSQLIQSLQANIPITVDQELFREFVSES